MSDLVYDLYDKHPEDGGVNTHRVTKEHYGFGTFYEHHLSSMGFGRIVFEKEQTLVDADVLSTTGYVLVRDFDLDAVDMTANVLGGFWPEHTDATVVSDPGEGLILRGGPSTIAMLKRAIMGPESLSPFGGPFSIVDGYWRWGNDSYGGVWRRALIEANLQDPPALPMLEAAHVGIDDINWNDDDDSNGDPWPYFSGEFRTRCGTDLLTLADELFGFGIEWDIDARTLAMYAYNVDGFGTDRSSATFAAGKVRFVEGVNIRDKLQRKTEGYLPLTHLLMRTTDYPQGAWIESDTYTPGDPVRKGVYQTGDISGDPAASTVLQARAQRVMRLRREAEEGITFYVSKPSTGTGDGEYIPGPNYTPGATVTDGDYWVGDWVTIHSGSQPYDYNNATKRIESIAYELSEAGEWDVQITVGARILADGSPGLTGSVGPTVQPVIELCRAATETVDQLLFRWEWSDTDPEPIADIPGVQASGFVGTGSAGWTHHSTEDGWMEDTGAGGVGRWLPGTTSGPSLLAAACAPGDVIRITARIRDPAALTAIAIGFFSGVQFAFTQLSVDQTGLTAAASSAWTEVSAEFTAPASSVGFAIKGADDVEIEMVEGYLVSGVSGAPHDGREELVGTSVKAKRCDDTEHYHTNADPTTGDNWADGAWREGTLWVNTTSGEAFLLIDKDAGTWLSLGGGSTHPDLAAHNTLGLATQAELDAHAADGVLHGGGGGGGAASSESVITANVVMGGANTWTDSGASLSLAAGTWILMANCVIRTTQTGATAVGARICNSAGTTIYTNVLNNLVSNNGQENTLTPIARVVLGATTTVKLQAIDVVRTAVIVADSADASQAADKSTRLIAIASA